MEPTQSKLTPQQHLAAAALISSPSLVEAASAAQINERTLRRWLEQPEFAALVAQLESQLIDFAVHRLVDFQQEAIDTIRELCHHSDDERIKLRAAQILLDSLLKLRVQQTFEARLAELEQIAFEE